jgi:quinol monooxygenase YgiN
MYAYVWEFRVHLEHKAEFEAAYGVGGEWEALFRRDPGHVRTDLLLDRDDSLRFMTIDYWTSRERYHSFRNEFSAEFEAIDSKCEAFTVSERLVGEFELPD